MICSVFHPPANSSPLRLFDLASQGEVEEKDGGGHAILSFAVCDSAERRNERASVGLAAWCIAAMLCRTATLRRPGAMPFTQRGSAAPR